MTSHTAVSCKPLLTLVVPVYEEEENIIPFLREVVVEIDIPLKAVIVYDSDEDSTLTRKQEASDLHAAFEFVKNRHGSGVINAFRTGFELADTPYVVPIMADLSDTPETIRAMYERILDGYDVVVASRYVRGGDKIGGPKLKKVLSRFANLTLKRLTGLPVHDMTNAFVMYRREVLDRIEIESTGGFEITMEIIAKAYMHGFRLTEVPTINRDRQAGSSKFQLAEWVFKYLYWAIRLMWWSSGKRLRCLLPLSNRNTL